VGCYGEREPITGVWVRSLPETDGILVQNIFCTVLELVVVADLTEATRKKRTIDTVSNFIKQHSETVMV